MMGSRSTPALSSRSRASGADTGRSRMSEARRQRLRDIQRRAMLQDTLKEKLLATYGDKFVAPEAAKRVIAEEVSKVVASPVISHIDIEEMQKKVHERSMLTGRSGRRSRASARQAAGQSVIASARYKPHMSGKQLSTARRTGQGARVPRQNMRGSTNRGRPKRNSLKLPRLDASGNAPPDAAPQQQSNGAPPSRGSDAVPTLRMPAREEHGQPQTDAGGDSLDDVAAKFEKEKWKHTSANAYGSFMPPEGLEILPQKPKRVGQEDRATVEWNLITEFELEKAAAKDAEEHAREKKEKVETVAFLHKQAQEKALAKQREREASLAYDRQKMEELRRLEQEEAERAAAKRKKELADRKEYEKALAVAIEAKRKAQELEALADQAYAQNAAKAVREEAAKEEARIAADKAKFQTFLRHNEAELKLKEERRKQEADEDYKRMLAYMKHMDKQEEARVAYFKEFQEKTKRKHELDLDTTSRAKALEDLVNRRVEQAQKRDEEERRRAKETAAARKKKAVDDQLRVLAQQIAEKEEAKKRLREEARAEMQATEQRILESKRLEEEEKRKAKQRHLKYKKDLEAQIRSNAQTPVDPYFHMSNTERMLNYDKLVKAKELQSQRSRMTGRSRMSQSRSQPVLSTRNDIKPFSARRQ